MSLKDELDDIRERLLALEAEEYDEGEDAHCVSCESLEGCIDRLREELRMYQSSHERAEVLRKQVAASVAALYVVRDRLAQFCFSDGLNEESGMILNECSLLLRAAK